MQTKRYKMKEVEPLHQEILALLNRHREQRTFDAKNCMDAKVALINNYFDHFNLDTAVIGVSGGLDSSVTAALLAKAKQAPGSPIEKILAVALPSSDHIGVTNQERATSQARLLSDYIDIEWHNIDLSECSSALRSTILKQTGLSGSSWSSGQLIPYLRTTTLYYLTALMSDSNHSAIVCGTTNRDEGAYLGFFGKASDGLVDLQIVSDLHKSEMFKLAKLLELPDKIVNADPCGDVHDGATHLEMIGAPYDFVELYLMLLRSGQMETSKASLSAEALIQFETYQERLEQMHRYNLHKYLGASPSVHLDVFERGVPGGWKDDISSIQTTINRALVNEFVISSETIAKFNNKPEQLISEPLADLKDEGTILNNLFSDEESTLLVSELARQNLVPVGTNGILRDYQPDKDKIGSFRASAYSPELADVLWQRLKNHIPGLRIFDDLTLTDSKNHKVWKAVGVNPAMRFIWYNKDGTLIPHYDAGYDFGDGSNHTLMSLVIYLTDAPKDSGGATRFILDQQRNFPWSERDYSDWDRMANEHEILFKVTPAKGKAIIFDHRLLHDSENWTANTPKVIIRTDIIFQQCGPNLLEPNNDTTQTSIDKQFYDEIVADRYYSKLITKSSTYEDILKAGYLPKQNSCKTNFNCNLLLTPISKIQAPTPTHNTQEWPTVLVTTGGFCPVHNGHIQMLENARTALINQGRTVIGGYLAPDHDDYILQKCPERFAPAELRISWCQAATEQNDWIMVDPWPAYYAKQALNYTDIIVRLEHYLAKHIRTLRPIRVSYVCGSDNQNFSAAFKKRGELIIVTRNGVANTTKQSKRIVVCAGNNPVSSRNIFEFPEHFSSSARDYFCNTEPNVKRTIFIRDEQGYSIKLWNKKIAPKSLMHALNNFKCKLVHLLASTIDNCSVQLLPLSSQELEYSDNFKIPTISLDSQIWGDYQIRLSRKFSIVDSIRSPELVASPGSPALEQQIEKIPFGSYLLFDDDIATGQTIEKTKALLTDRRQVIETQCLAKNTTGQSLNTVNVGSINDLIDIGDLRDFLVGGCDGGLVVELPNGKMTRVPYMAPYVVLNQRMSLPIDLELLLAYKLWQLNYDFFSSLTYDIKVKDCQKHFIDLAEYLGFPPCTPLKVFCKIHIELLSKDYATRETNRQYIYEHSKNLNYSSF